MRDNSTRQGVVWTALAGTPLVGGFDQEHAGSDGSATLLQTCKVEE